MKCQLIINETVPREGTKKCETVARFQPFQLLPWCRGKNIDAWGPSWIYFLFFYFSCIWNMLKTDRNWLKKWLILSIWIHRSNLIWDWDILRYYLQEPRWSSSATAAGAPWWEPRRPTRTATSSCRRRRPSRPTRSTSARSLSPPRRRPQGARSPPTSTAGSRGPPCGLRSLSWPISCPSCSTPWGLSRLSPSAPVDQPY